MSHWAHINIWPDELINLNREIANHPTLIVRLQNNGHKPEDWESRLCEVAHYCEVIVDGEYLPEEIVKLCELLLPRLIEKRERIDGLVIISTT